jgi:hypothetical protein
LSSYTEQTLEREPNLSFHFANEIHPYLSWLRFDCNIAKPHLADRRPDIVFHCRGILDLDCLAVEVKRQRNPKGIKDDLKKIRDDWFGEQLRYRFGAGILIDDVRKTFSGLLLENIADDVPMEFTQGSEQLWRPVVCATPEQFKEISNVVGQIAEAEKANHETGELKLKLDQLVCTLYAHEK